MATFKAIFKKTLFERMLWEVLLGKVWCSPGGGHPAPAEGIPSQGLAHACQEFLRHFPKSGPSQNSHKGGTVGMVWRKPGQLPPLEITCHFPNVQTHLFCAGSIASKVWEWAL